jgi:hypothetical protein
VSQSNDGRLSATHRRLKEPRSETQPGVGAHPSSPPPSPYEDGFAAGRASVEATIADGIEQARARIETEYELKHRQWVNDQVDALSNRIEQSLSLHLATLRSEISTVLEAEVLRSSISLALDRLTNTIMRLVEHELQPITVSGPQDLIDVLRHRLAQRGITTSQTAGSGSELAARVGTTEFRLAIADLMQHTFEEDA